jgi:hypothetical protein
MYPACIYPAKSEGALPPQGVLVCAEALGLYDENAARAKQCRVLRWQHHLNCPGRWCWAKVCAVQTPGTGYGLGVGVGCKGERVKRGSFVCSVAPEFARDCYFPRNTSFTADRSWCGCSHPSYDFWHVAPPNFFSEYLEVTRHEWDAVCELGM